MWLMSTVPTRERGMAHALSQVHKADYPKEGGQKERRYCGSHHQKRSKSGLRYQNVPTPFLSDVTDARQHHERCARDSSPLAPPSPLRQAQRLMEGYSSGRRRSSSAPTGGGAVTESKSQLPVSLRMAVVRAKVRAGRCTRLGCSLTRRQY